MGRAPRRPGPRIRQAPTRTPRAPRGPRSCSGASNREPDAGGARYWIDVYDRGASLDVIAEAFTQSPEFRNAYDGTSNGEYVRRVYRNVLGRTYDEAGYRYWLGLLDTRRLTRGTLVRWVAANAEFVQRYPYAAIPR